MEKEALFAIYEAASDYILAVKFPEFAKECGGIERLLRELECAVSAYTIEYNTLDEDE